MTSIPLAGYRRLDRARRRTTAIRAGLVVLLAVLVVAAGFAATRAHAKTLSFLPHGSSGLIVLDLSASISTDTFQRIGATLSDLAATNGRYGLIVFSDVAYQALPPGTPSAALKPYARYFTLPPAQNGFLPQFPANPWTNSFSGGTRIGAGLALALRTIETKRLARPAVILVSDLDDDPGDLKTLAGVSLAYRQAGIPVRIVALDPQPKDEALFGHLLERAATVQQARLPSERVQTVGADAPALLSTLVVLAALALAVNELWAARLTWSQA